MADERRSELKITSRTEFDSGVTRARLDFDDQDADGGIRLSATSQDNPDESVIYWDGSLTFQRYYEAEDFRPIFEGDEQLAEVEVTNYRTSLGGLREITDFTLTALASGLLGTVASDGWRKIKEFVAASKSSDLRPLDRVYAHHMARWFVATEFGVGRYEHGSWIPDLEELLSCVSEERSDDQTWTFVYEDDDFRYTVSVVNKDDLHATVARLKRERRQSLGG